jgi:polar amino acid transport system substrate-binding protein
VIIGGDPWCPFTCQQESDKPGILIEIAKKIFADAGHSVTYQTLAWSRAVSETREGQIAGVAGALKSDAPDFVFPTASAVSQKSCFYVKKSSQWKFKDVTSFRGHSLGAVKDYTYGDPLDGFIASQDPEAKKIDFVTGTGTTKKLFKKLAAGRNDMIVEDQSVAAYNLANDAELKGVDVAEAGCLRAVPLYVAFSPHNPKSLEYAKIFSQGFERFKKTPEFKSLLKRYGL